MEKLRNNVINTIPDVKKICSWKGCQERLTRCIKRNQYYQNLRAKVARNRRLTQSDFNL